MNNFLTQVKNVFTTGYKNHSEAAIVTCYYNPENNQDRLYAFKEFYKKTQHLNLFVIEASIKGSPTHLDSLGVKNLTTVSVDSNLWHKETLLNKLIKSLPKKYKYVFWLDADVIFTNDNWLVEGVEQLKTHKIIQPFEYCFHLNEIESIHLKPTKEKMSEKATVNMVYPNRSCWKSFCYNWKVYNYSAQSEIYDIYGHVGFAWGAQREFIETIGLYEKALIGGADHIMAIAATGRFFHPSIEKAYSDDIVNVRVYMQEFYNLLGGDNQLSYVKGDLYHIWHGDLKKREYYKRIKDFTKHAAKAKKDKSGFYQVEEPQATSYYDNYYKKRETNTIERKDDDDFLTSLVIGYATDSSLTGALLGGNALGAMLGDSLNNSDETVTTNNDNNPVEFGGGDFGGAGATGDFDAPTNVETIGDSTQNCEPTCEDNSNLGNFS